MIHTERDINPELDLAQIHAPCAWSNRTDFLPPAPSNITIELSNRMYERFEQMLWTKYRILAIQRGGAALGAYRFFFVWLWVLKLVFIPSLMCAFFYFKPEGRESAREEEQDSPPPLSPGPL